MTGETARWKPPLTKKKTRLWHTHVRTHARTPPPPPLTDAWYDVEEVVDLLVDRRGDDFDLRESVGHRVDAHLGHQQRHHQDLVLLDVVVLENAHI